MSQIPIDWSIEGLETSPVATGNDDRWYTKPAPLFLMKGHCCIEQPARNWADVCVCVCACVCVTYLGVVTYQDLPAWQSNSFGMFRPIWGLEIHPYERGMSYPYWCGNMNVSFKSGHPTPSSCRQIPPKSHININRSESPLLRVKSPFFLVFTTFSWRFFYPKPTRKLIWIHMFAAKIIITGWWFGTCSILFHILGIW